MSEDLESSERPAVSFSLN